MIPPNSLQIILVWLPDSNNSVSKIDVRSHYLVIPELVCTWNNFVWDLLLMFLRTWLLWAMHYQNHQIHLRKLGGNVGRLGIFWAKSHSSFVPVFACHSVPCHEVWPSKRRHHLSTIIFVGQGHNFFSTVLCVCSWISRYCSFFTTPTTNLWSGTKKNALILPWRVV